MDRTEKRNFQGGGDEKGRDTGRTAHFYYA